ncbi:Nn.00g118110.m01.CDS01 [Neocucurbitaria sp. VM-36]
MSSSSDAPSSSSSSVASSSSSSSVPTTFYTMTSSSSSSTAPTTSTAALTTIPSSTSTSTSTPICNAATPTNYVTNPGLETAGSSSVTAASWTLTADNNWSTSSGIYSTTGHTGAVTRLLLGRTSTSNNVGALTFAQALTNIPSGTTRINVSAWVKPLANIPSTSTTNVFTMTLYFDNVAVISWTPTSSNVNVWKQLKTSTPVTVSTASSHTFRLVVNSKGYPNANVFFADDFAVTPAFDSDGLVYCT